MIVVDTSVWVDHLRKGDNALVSLLERNLVMMHPFVIHEIALGNLSSRANILGLFRLMPECKLASDNELANLIELQELFGRGIGLVDVHLIASCLLTPETALWTRDKRLVVVATELGFNYQP